MTKKYLNTAQLSHSNGTKDGICKIYKNILQKKCRQVLGRFIGKSANRSLFDVILKIQINDANNCTIKWFKTSQNLSFTCILISIHIVTPF